MGSLHHMLELFIAPPDDDAQPHRPDRNKQQERRRNESERLDAENLLKPDAKREDSQNHRHDPQDAPLLPQREPRFILDCGENVGYSSCYFLTRFPTARVFAVEPDPGNADLLRRNLAPYGRRCTIFQTAVWSRPVELVMSTTPFRDGREWARQVREAEPDETPEMFATDIPSLIEESGEARVGVLKMDIEGAETEVFSVDCSSWIPRVDVFIVEVHDEIASRTFVKALGVSDFDVSRHGEVTVAIRRGRPKDLPY